MYAQVTNGITEDFIMPSQAYIDMEGVNYSSLKHMLAGPDVYKYYKEHKQPTSKEMMLGNLIELAVLEPANFEANVYFASKHNRATKIGKEGYARDIELAGKRIIVSPEEKLSIDRALLALSRSYYWQELLSHGLPSTQVVLQHVDAITGFKLKGCLDFLLDAPTLGPYIIDLKTTREIFNKHTIRKFHYDMQAAHYVDLYKGATGRDADFMWLTIETQIPYGCQLIAASAETLESGRAKMRECLDKLKQAEESGDWYSRYNQLTVI